jgi:hypothetical protein
MRLGLGNTLVDNGLSNPDLLSLDLQFAADKTLTARRGPTPAFTRANPTATFVGSDGLIQTATTNIPRFDHDPVTLECKGLLIEDQRTNLYQHSSNFLNAYWATGTAVSSATSSNPDGTTSAFLVTSAGTTASVYNDTPITVTASTVYTISVYVKAGTVAANTLVMAAFDATAGGFISGATALVPTFTDAGNGWYRATASVTTPVGCLLLRAYVCRTTFTGNFYVWGAQLEAGSFATSYIPRVTGTGIRSADVCSITSTAFSGFYNQTEGTFVTQTIKPTSSTNAFCFHASDNTFNNGLDLRYNSITNAGAVMNVSNVSQLTGFSGTITSGSNAKQSLAYKLNDCAYSLNGGTAVTDSTASIPTINRLNIGAAYTTGYELNGTISSIRYFKKRLTNAKLQTLTT